MTDRLLKTIRVKNEEASGPAVLVGTSTQLYESGQVLEYTWGFGVTGSRQAKPEEIALLVSEEVDK
jgi:hypothetical protein